MEQNFIQLILSLICHVFCPILQKKKIVKTRKWTTNSKQTARKETSSKIDPNHTTTQTAPLGTTKKESMKTTPALHFTSNSAWLVSEYTFICYCFNLLSIFFLIKNTQL